MARYTDTVRDQNLSPVVGALVSVRRQDGTTPVLTDDSGHPIGNPLKTDIYGGYSFNADADYYDLKYYFGARLLREDYQVPVGAISLPTGSVVDALGTSTTSAPSQRAVRAGIATVNLADYHSGTLAYVSPYTSTTYAARQAAPNIDDALDAAFAEASARLLSGAKIAEVRIPPGLFTLARTHVRPNGVMLVGSGCDIFSGATHLRRVGGYGDTFQSNPGAYVPGTFSSGGGYSGFRLYVDHGGDGMWGYVNPPAGSFINKVASGSHFSDKFPKDIVYENLSLWGMPGTFAIQGGADCKWRNIDVHAIYDPLSAARQESYETFAFDGDLTIGIPTSFDFDNVTISGDKVAGNVTYPGGFTSSTIINQGPRRGFVVKCAEEWRIKGLYIQGCAESDVVFRGKAQPSGPQSSIIQGLKFTGCGFDPCGAGIYDAAIKFEDEGITSAVPAAITFSGCQILFQGNGYVGVSDKSTTDGKASVVGFSWDGEASTFVGNAFYLRHARHISISGSVRAYNNNNYYTGDDACGIYFGSEAGPWVVNATIGGSSSGAATAGHSCIDGVRWAAPASVLGNVSGAANGGLIGSLYVANGKIMDRLLDDGSIVIRNNADFTYDIKTSAKSQVVNSPLGSSDMTITLPTTGVPSGWSIYFQRTVGATGSGRLLAGQLQLTAADTSGTVTYYEGVGWLKTSKASLA